MGMIRSKRFAAFVKSPDTFRVYKGSRLLFSSCRGNLTPVLEYMDTTLPFTENVTVYDRTTGNAAALLMKSIKASRVLSELGSRNAINTLNEAGIKYHFNKTVDCVMNDAGTDICPMEKLSMGKSAEGFYLALQSRTKK
jgi:hypothetical protein